MAKISANYEVVYILDPAQGERLLPPMWQSSRLWLSKDGCSDVVVDEWGKRRLARHRLQDRRLLCADELHQRTGIPKELDRILGITEGVMRSMIVCKDE